MDDDGNRLVNEVFYSIALRFHDRPALVFQDHQTWVEWSYRKLADRSRELAACLIDQGTRPGDAVGVVAARHPDTIASMIAILEIGAHYVPLDPVFPAARLRFLCEQSKTKTILSALPRDDLKHFPMPVQSVGGVGFSKAGTARPVANGRGCSEDSPAYVMFTSGSTGEPKGVVIPHRAIVRLVDKPNFMRLDSSRTFLSLAPYGFDASTLEIWGPLLNGGKCVLFPDLRLPTASGLKAVIKATGVNAMWLTASLFNSILDQDASGLAGLDELLIGGETLSVAHVCKALAELKGTQLINGYGPTENTTFTTCFRIPADFSREEPRVPIGSPVSGTDVAIVDEQLRPVAAGVEGELVALGDGLALGYLNRPDLTRQRFVEITRTDGVLARGYRTGDRVVRRRDGVIDFLGRSDDQVKIDGHRIEPGEIERVIATLPGITNCRVLLVNGRAGQKRLAAYAVATESASKDNFKNQLHEILPAFMVPHYVFFLDALPVNANGKLDKAALPDPFAQAGLIPTGIRSPNFALVSDAWQEILGQRPSSDELNFFDAGGTSLDALRLHEVLSERFSRELDPTFVFEHTTVRGQAEAMSSPARVETQTDTRGQQRRSAIARARRRA